MGEHHLTDTLANFVCTDNRGIAESDIAEKAKQHVLDTLVAILSGYRLPAGIVAQAYARAQSPTGPATVLGTGGKSATEVAALANGTAAHADETDDCNELARLHPGASIIPAALAMGERFGAGGKQLLQAVSVGYDVGCCLTRAAWGTIELRQKSVQRPSGVGQTFGAMAAAAVMANLTERQVRHAMAYTAQMASGLTSYLRDDAHIEKAFALGGMQARAGVSAVELVLAGATGVEDILDTYPTLFDVFGKERAVDVITEELGTVSHLMTTDLKRYSTGGPTQAAVQALEEIVTANDIRSECVSRITCKLPSGKGAIVVDRDMPDIDAAHLLALGVVDGRITFFSSHDYKRVHDPVVRSLRDRVEIVLDPTLDPEESLAGSSRRAIVTIEMNDGRSYCSRVDHFRGSRLNRMHWSELEAKAHDVLSDWGEGHDINGLIASVRSLDADLPISSLVASASPATAECRADST